MKLLKTTFFLFKCVYLAFNIVGYLRLLHLCDATTFLNLTSQEHQQLTKEIKSNSQIIQFIQLARYATPSPFRLATKQAQ